MKTSTSLCYFALNLMRSNFTCYEALNRPSAISRLTCAQKFACYEALNRPFAISRLT
ncbi:MAG: hypothetical protein IPL33_20865 [Sphingobacteriales bacterium]|nr:hypothetical protein [Sphingobacteriales bacterium]